MLGNAPRGRGLVTPSTDGFWRRPVELPSRKPGLLTVTEFLDGRSRQIGVRMRAQVQRRNRWDYACSTAIALTMLGFTFLGDGLQDALDPKQQVG